MRAVSSLSKESAPRSVSGFFSRKTWYMITSRLWETATLAFSLPRLRATRWYWAARYVSFMRERIQATSPSIARTEVFPVRVAELRRLPPLCLFPGQSGSQPTRWCCNSFFVWPLLTELTEQLIGMTSQLRLPYPPVRCRNGEKEQGAANDGLPVCLHDFAALSCSICIVSM